MHLTHLHPLRDSSNLLFNQQMHLQKVSILRSRGRDIYALEKFQVQNSLHGNSTIINLTY